MLEPDTLADLATELRALPGRQRQAILGSLSAAERSRMTELLNRPVVAPQPPSAPVAERKIEGLSPWLTARVRQAESGTAPSGAAWKMTAATQQLLRRSADDLAEPETRVAATIAAPAKGRSLLGAIGGMLSQKRALP